MDVNLSLHVEEPRESTWGKDPKLQCSFCLYTYGVAVWTDHLKLVRFRNREVLACRSHENRRDKRKGV